MAYATDYDLWVGGKQVTSSIEKDVFGDGKVSYSPGTAGNPGTLTLNGYSYSGKGYDYTKYNTYGAGIYTDNSSLKIVLNGDNSVIVSGNSTGNYGFSINGNLIIEGSGNLTATGGVEAAGSSGIFVMQKLTIDGGNVSANGQNGIYVANDLTINSGNITAIGNKYGITIYSGNAYINGGNVTASGNGNNGYGIYAANGLTISGGKVSATGNEHGINAGSGSNYVDIVDDGTVIAAGGTKSIFGIVHNTKIGTGWTDKEGTEGEEQISVSTGQNLSFRKVQFPEELDPATVSVAPKAKTLTYTGSAQELVTAGTTDDGTMQYALGVNGTTAPTTGYTSSIPSGTNSGIYYVWFKAKGNTGYTDSTPGCVQVTIGKAEPVVTTPTAKTLTYTGSAQELVNAGKATGGTMQYALGTKDAATGSYTTSIPTKTDAGTYYVWYKVKGDENHSDAAPAGPVTVTINAAGLKILCDPENGGRVEQVSFGEDYVGYTAIPAEGWKFLKWTYNANVSGIGPQEFSGKDAFFMFTATDIVAHFVKGDDEIVTITLDAAGGTGTMAPVQIEKGSQYTFPKSSFIPPADKVFAHWKIGEKPYAVNDVITVNADLTVTAVWTEEKSEEEKSEDKDSKIVSVGLTSVPDGLKDKFSSIKDLKSALLRALSSKGTFAGEENTVFYDVVLMVRRNGGDWVPATKEDFEDGPLTVKLEYPAGTGMNTHNFTVVHMFTVNTPGEVEIPAVTKKEDGIYVNLDGLSPVAISWTKIDEKAIDSLPQTGDTERPLIYGLVALAACIGVGLLIKKK